jgi:hypothetical protein
MVLLDQILKASTLPMNQMARYLPLLQAHIQFPEKRADEAAQHEVSTYRTVST